MRNFKLYGMKIISKVTFGVGFKTKKNTRTSTWVKLFAMSRDIIDITETTKNFEKRDVIDLFV